jgi:hypothetical protein
MASVLDLFSPSDFVSIYAFLTSLGERVWWNTLVNPAQGRQRRENNEFQENLSYVVGPCLKKQYRTYIIVTTTKNPSFGKTFPIPHTYHWFEVLYFK